MSISGNRKFWEEFLELYRKHPVLWRVKSEEYGNRVLKANAYEKMVAKLKEVEPGADRDMVVRKINTFRSNYRRDLKKQKQSQISGDGADDIFESTLWYFDLLGFLEDQDDSLEGRSSITNGKQSAEVVEDRLNKPGPSKKRKVLPEFDYLQDSYNDASVHAKGWASQYAELSSLQQIFARKIISDTLFHGCLEHLNENIVYEIEKTFIEKSNEIELKSELLSE